MNQLVTVVSRPGLRQFCLLRGGFAAAQVHFVASAFMAFEPRPEDPLAAELRQVFGEWFHSCYAIEFTSSTSCRITFSHLAQPRILRCGGETVAMLSADASVLRLNLDSRELHAAPHLMAAPTMPGYIA